MSTIRKGPFYGVVAVMVVSSILYFTILLAKPSILDTFTDFSVAVLSFLPVISGFHLVNRYSLDSPFGKCFAFLTAGSSLWFLGEALWPVYTRILKVDMPFPSLSDLFWMSGYIFMWLGAYIIFTIFNPIYVLKRRIILLTLLLIAVSSVVTLILTPKIYKAPPLNLIIYNYYLIADIVVLGLLSTVYIEN